jgi:uncharacterized protein
MLNRHFLNAKGSIFGVIMLFFGGNLVTAQSFPIKKSKHNIVMQLTSSDTLVHKSMMKQLFNLKEGWGEDVAIEVVLHGPGIDFLREGKATFAEQAMQLKNQGIVFVVCENSLKERKVAPFEIVPGHAFVKMGIGELVWKQEEGWSYIKAGF